MFIHKQQVGNKDNIHSAQITSVCVNGPQDLMTAISALNCQNGRLIDSSVTTITSYTLSIRNDNKYHHLHLLLGFNFRLTLILGLPTKSTVALRSLFVHCTCQHIAILVLHVKCACLSVPRWIKIFTKMLSKNST